MTISLNELAKRLQAEASWLDSDGGCRTVDSDFPTLSITHLARPCDATASSLSFLFGSRATSRDVAQSAEAGGVIVDSANAGRVPRPFIVDEPLVALAKAGHWLPVVRSPLNGAVGAIEAMECGTGRVRGLPPDLEHSRMRYQVHESSVLGKDVVIGDSSCVGPNATIGEQVRIGDFCRIGANVTINGPVKIGNRVNIDANCTIGGEAFMYVADGGHWLKVPGFCGVIVNDDVDIGSGSTIDRGLTDHTVIGQGVKLDSQVHLGHGVTIGRDTVMAGRTTVAGEAVIGAGCKIGGACAISEGVTVAENVTLLGMSAVTRSLEAEGEYTSAWPVQPRAEWWKQLATMKAMAKR